LILLERILVDESFKEDDGLIRLKIGNVGLRELLEELFTRKSSSGIPGGGERVGNVGERSVVLHLDGEFESFSVKPSVEVDLFFQ